jgi:hypothetical protein
MLVGFWFLTVMPMFPEVPAMSVEPSGGYYLADRALNMTRLFVVSATPRYGFYPVEPENVAGPFMINRGDPCFIMELTIRNDYNQLNPPPTSDLGSNSNYSSDEAWFCVRANLSNENGLIHVPAVTPPYPQMPFGVPQFHQKSGTTQSYTIYFSTKDRTINHYQIYVSYLAAYPAP